MPTPRWLAILLICYYPWMFYAAWLRHGDVSLLWGSLFMSAIALGGLYIIHRYAPRSEE